MAAAAPTSVRPESVDEAATALRELGEAGRPLRIAGGDTKRGWLATQAEIELETGGLGRLLEHNEGDFTAVLEAGLPLHEAQAQFARAGQMLALDPPLSGDGSGPAATVGGVVATADSGPLRHRYGGMRDLILGVTVVLSDGTVAKAGGRVIKNVAGYDLAKLFTGSYGTLGLIATVAVRLHPLPERAATMHVAGDDPAVLARAAGRLAALPLEADCLDLGWSGASGRLLVRFAGSTARERAQETARLVGELGLPGGEVTEEDDGLWAAQRAAQREPGGTVIKCSALPAQSLDILRAAQRLGARAVVRPALGLAWVAFAAGAGDGVAQLRAALPDTGLTALDGATELAERWPAPPEAALGVMQRLKARFDPARICAPAAFVGGL